MVSADIKVASLQEEQVALSARLEYLSAAVPSESTNIRAKRRYRRPSPQQTPKRSDHGDDHNE
jgi:hypothetical protein